MAAKRLAGLRVLHGHAEVALAINGERGEEAGVAQLRGRLAVDEGGVV